MPRYQHTSCPVTSTRTHLHGKEEVEGERDAMGTYITKWHYNWSTCYFCAHTAIPNPDLCRSRAVILSPPPNPHPIPPKPEPTKPLPARERQRSGIGMTGEPSPRGLRSPPMRILPHRTGPDGLKTRGEREGFPDRGRERSVLPGPGVP